MREPNAHFLDIDLSWQCRVDLCYVKDRKLPPAAHKLVQFVRLWTSG